MRRTRLFLFGAILLCSSKMFAAFQVDGTFNNEPKFATAQEDEDIPNASFENWAQNETTISGTKYTYTEPVGWGTLNIFGESVTKSEDAKVGLYSAKIETKTYDMTSLGMGIVNTACLMTGSYVDAIKNGEPTFGFPYTKKPTALRLWYKYQPNGTDKAQVCIVISKYNSQESDKNTVGKGVVNFTENTSEWTQTTIPISYEGYTDDTPDSCTIDITSSLSYLSHSSSQDDKGGNVGSVLYVDGLEFVYETDDIPNASFENWEQKETTIDGTKHTYTEPEGWGTLNIFGESITKSENAKVGLYSAKIETKTYDMSALDMGIVNTACLMTGSYVDAIKNGEPTFAFPYTKKPTSLRLWYKYQPNGTDKAQVCIFISKYNSTESKNYTVGKGFVNFTETTSEWTQTTIPITYQGYADGTPDSCTIDITSSLSYLSHNSSQDDKGGNVGSVLYVDGLEFLFGTEDIPTINNEEKSISFKMSGRDGVEISYSNSAEKATIHIYSTSGAMMKELAVSSGEIINISNLNKGIYTLEAIVKGKRSTIKIER